MKICIYTCIFGDYETLRNHIKIDDIDYVLFTDNKKLKSEFWDIRYVENNTNESSALFYKKIKCHPEIYLSEYETTIWLDANFIVKNDVFLDFLLYNYKSNKIMLYKHFCMANFPRDCAYIEGEYSITLPKYNKEKNKIIEQLTHYKEDGFPEHYGLFQSGFLLRNNRDEEVINFNKVWYSEIKKWSVITPQCQVSLPYVLWKTNIDKDILKNKIWDTNIYDIYSHNK